LMIAKAILVISLGKKPRKIPQMHRFGKRKA
jgi:hypothetical protein